MRQIISIFGGAIIIFIWGYISWGVLKWHQKDWKSFKNAAHVQEVIKDNVFEKGIYMLPDTSLMKASGENMKQCMKKKAEGPFFYAVIRPFSKNISMAKMMLGGFAVCLAQSTLAVLLLSMTKNSASYVGKVFFITICGAFAGTCSHLINYNYWEFPLNDTIVNIADLIISCFFLGAFISLFKPQKVKLHNL